MIVVITIAIILNWDVTIVFIVFNRLHIRVFHLPLPFQIHPRKSKPVLATYLRYLVKFAKQTISYACTFAFKFSQIENIIKKRRIFR